MATGEPIDVRDVGRDDSLLDSLGQRRHLGVTDDPAARLLAALAADVDEETVARRLRAGRLSSLPLPGDRGHPRLLAAAVQRHGLRHASRSALVAVVAVGVLSISGVAAAMTGDALAPLKAVVSSVTGVDLPRGGDPGAASGAVERDLAGAEAALSHGDTTRARKMLVQAKQRLPTVPTDEKADLISRLNRIEQRINQREEGGPTSIVVVSATPTPSVAVAPPDAGEPTTAPTEPVTSPSPSASPSPSSSPSPEPTAAEPTESPSPSPTPEASDEPTRSPIPDGTGGADGPTAPKPPASSPADPGHLSGAAGEHSPLR